MIADRHIMITFVMSSINGAVMPDISGNFFAHTYYGVTHAGSFQKDSKAPLKDLTRLKVTPFFCHHV